MEKYLMIIPDLCTGCNRCVYICSAVKEGRFIPSKSRIVVNNFPLEGRSVPSVCFQCEDAPCMEACSVEAIKRNDEGVVIISEEDCVGCGACVEACPYGNVRMNEEKDVAIKCDLCGGDPACVKECNFDALIFEELDGEKVDRRKRFMSYKSEVESVSGRRLEWAKKVFESLWVEK